MGKPKREKKAGPSFLDNITSNEDLMSILSWLGPVVLCIAVFAVVKFACSFVEAPDMSVITKQEDQIKELQDTLTLRDNQYKDMQALTTDVSQLQVYTGQEDPNDRIAQTFFERITTWSDGEEYEALRDYLMSLGYDEYSTLMNCFLPEQDITYDMDGHRIYEIDTKKSNLKFASLTPYRHYVDGAVSHYGAIVQVSSEDLTGMSLENNIQRTSAYATYDVVNGEIQNVEAYALIQP